MSLQRGQISTVINQYRYKLIKIFYCNNSILVRTRDIIAQNSRPTFVVRRKKINDYI